MIISFAALTGVQIPNNVSGFVEAYNSEGSSQMIFTFSNASDKARIDKVRKVYVKYENTDFVFNSGFYVQDSYIVIPYNDYRLEKIIIAGAVANMGYQNIIYYLFVQLF